MIDRDDIISEPYVRDIFTRSLSPSLASQAPNVSIIILTVGKNIDLVHISIGINRTVLNMIPSKDSNLIRKFERCISRATIIA